MRFSPPHSLVLLSSLALGLALVVGGCDFGAAQKAIESTGVIVELEDIETTVSGQVVDAASGELVDAPVTLRFTGPDGASVVDMYSDPIASQEVTGAVTSFGIQNGLHPSSKDPVRLGVVADVEGYQSTSTQLQIHDTGTKQFVVSVLSEDPARQPQGASGVRDQSGQASSEGEVENDVDVQTQSKNGQGETSLYLAKNTVLESGQGNVQGNITVDLIHYSSTDRTMEALPGNGTVQTGSKTERFSVAGYMNLQIHDADGSKVTRIDQAKRGGTPSTAQVRFSEGAEHPETGDALEDGDELELFRYDTGAGTWTSDRTLTVQVLGDADQLGIEWSPQNLNESGWWAWGSRSQTSCEIGAQIQIDQSDQVGEVTIGLERTGLQYTNAHSIDELTGTRHSLSSLIGQSTVPDHDDYELTLTTRDGQSKTVESVDPCSGTYTLTPPAPTSTTERADVLFRGYPECPGDQKVRITSVPTVTIYYRESDAPSGASWHTAGENKIKWVMDDPDNPTYIKWAELRLDGLKQGTRYDMYTTYDGDRYGASELVPRKEEAPTEDGRVLVEYNQDFSDVCS